jgi:DNA end-binding protein Ku
MARPKKRTPSTRKKTKPKGLPFHAFWSGSLSFGLVNVPVLVFPASRHSGVRLRMISPDGALLERRYCCSRDGKKVTQYEIVRGFENDDGSYIIVTDDELEDLEPQKTREIDLREFVQLSEISPAFLERGYYLTPLKEATKAYVLLAEAMEKSQRAGIATFVMREREYMVAIFARNGILCAETLRFNDEVRDPGTIGLPEPKPAPRRDVAIFERSIDALFRRELPQDALADVDTQKLRTIIAKKKRAGEDLIRLAHESDNGDSEESDIDLLETIRQSLRRADQARATQGTRAKTTSKTKAVRAETQQNRRKPAKHTPSSRGKK